MNNKISKDKQPLRVAELFAGVGGFRLGLCGTAQKPLQGYKMVWSNQWEPATKVQHAAQVYQKKFHNEEKPYPFFNEDINKIVSLKKMPIPEHDLLVGGFPCQDYSVARTLSHAAGIDGKKGVLWWSIHRILERMDKKAPKYLMLENVDRLLKSPAKQRGRDFGIMLASLSDLGYAVEWRVINAADYGMPQRRRRIFILGYKKSTSLYRSLLQSEPIDWLEKRGVIAKAFPVHFEGQLNLLETKINNNLADITEKFEHKFENSGLMFERKFYTARMKPDYLGPQKTLGSILLSSNEVPREYFIPKAELVRWKYLKGAKKEQRSTKDGFKYSYNEGPIAFPDHLDRPSRTIITGEGGPTPSRFKHVIIQDGKYRRLTPLELERLCMFPDGHTAHPDIGDVKRAFFMGNALVVGVIEKLGRELLSAHRKTN